MNALDRLLAKVEAIEPNADGCRIWPHAVDKDGYGVTTLRDHGRRWRGTARVHRRVLIVKLGRSLAPEELACHTCDTPRCVEADHLWVGTALDNNRDAIAKGRRDTSDMRARLGDYEQVRGDAHGRRKLCSQEVLTIRDLLAKGAYARDLAPMFGVCPATISNIKRRKNWTHI